MVNRTADDARARWWLTFRDLVLRERAWLDRRRAESSGKGHRAELAVVHAHAQATQAPREPEDEALRVSISDIDEPRVVFTERDHFGIALSGGGIRSATFNLGVLQALGARGILDHADYLSTVSGGGYIGGFWTALRYRAHAAKENTATPAPLRDRSRDRLEPPHVRHLREFSRFLMPRVGFAVTETWAGIVAVLGGMIPSLLAAMALIASALYAWSAVVFLVLAPKGRFRSENDEALIAGVAFGLLTLLQHLSAEIEWQRSGRAGVTKHPSRGYVAALVSSVLAGVAWSSLRVAWGDAEVDGATPFKALGAWALDERPGARWWSAVQWVDAKEVDAQTLFAPALCALAVGVALLLVRAAVSRYRPSYELDRSAARCLFFALTWALAAGTWALAWKITGLISVSASTAASGGLFVWLRDWLRAKPEETHASTLFERLRRSLKPVIPQILALVSAWLLVLLTAVLLQRYAPVVAGASACAVVLFLTAWRFDPARIGLHEFYRLRLARCFLGAANPDGRAFHATSPQDDDDVPLDELHALRSGPIHLVCFAANNLAGDPLPTLYRGARSAALSPLGFSIGGFARPIRPREEADAARANAWLEGIGLSAVLTASGAAFNSQMGSVSMRLGPSVAFLMTALSLRLGLWLPHPLSRGFAPKWFPGRVLFREAFSRTRCEPITRAQADGLAAPELDVTRVPCAVASALRTRSVHLSDGGHFENLGLYELIRRHCRYVVVSDATADPTTSFDDLANAVRRVREDFGVEIELDVSPLRRGEDGLSKQHAVVGTIHYDGSGGIDKGVLLYFKPSILGEEPTDIMQYRRRNPAFPHEGTVDQFYDEAQWESYRRLGEHAVHAVMAFMDRGWRPQANFVERMFDEATKRWHPAQANHDEVFLELTNRCAALDSAVRDGAPLRLRAEFFPEIAATLGEEAGARSTLEDEIKTVYYLMYAIQVMEDVWVGAELDRYWSHPLNEGWMNYFQRWTNTPSFRRWWAILRPIYSLHFRDFVRDRFSVRIKDPQLNGDGSPERAAELKLRACAAADLSGLAVAMWQQRGGVLPAAGEALEYCLELPGESGALPAIQVGFLLYSRIDSTTVQWKRSAMFVSPALVGSGIVSRFLDAVIAHIHADGAERARVVLDDNPGAPAGDAPAVPQRRDAASRRECLNHLNFYKSRGFIDRDKTTSNGMRIIELDLPAPRATRTMEVTTTNGASLAGVA